MGNFRLAEGVLAGVATTEETICESKHHKWADMPAAAMANWNIA